MHSKDIAISFALHENSFIEMKQVYLLKINSCPIVKKTLLNTGNKSIIECNKFDQYWANGYTQIQSETFQPSVYIGRNYSGLIWEEIRNSIICHCGENTLDHLQVVNNTYLCNICSFMDWIE